MIAILAISFYLLTPALAIVLCRKFKFLNKIGEILLLYIIGLLVSNFVFFPLGIGEQLYEIQDILTSATILLAFPMILFGCDFRTWPVKKALVALFVGLLSVFVVDVAGFYIFDDGSDEFPKIAGLLIGVYTGGTPNLAALKLALDVDPDTYIFIHTFDMVISFVYLVFLMSFGIRLFRMFLDRGRKTGDDAADEKASGQMQGITAYSGIFTKKHFSKTLMAFGLALVVTAVSAGISLLVTGKFDNMLVLILAMTTLSIAVSFLPSVGKMEKSYDAGMYFVLVFSLVVASMVDVTAINYSAGARIIGYIAFVIFCSLILSVIIAKVLKIDSDTMVVTSVALINSPLFVPMIADSMRNRKVIITGIAAGVVGYAVGNYLGVLVFSVF